LEREAEVAVDELDAAARWLQELVGQRSVRRVLDVGSGPGVGSAVLAARFPDAEIVAVDGSPTLLDRACDRARRLGLGARVTVAHRQLPDGLTDLEPADLVWARRVLHHLGDQRGAVRLLAHRVRPGGVLAVAEGGLPRRVLPRDIGIGRPGLQERLDVAFQEWFSEMRAAEPDATETVEHWPGMLADAGLTPAGSRSFLVDHPAPLDAAVREVIVRWWQGIHERVADRISAEDRATLERLIDPGDTAGLAQREDVFLLNATTVHTGRAS
jgi:SAM-dependent methyltransferase